MPLAYCAGPACDRMVSLSSIPGGNPVALEDPEHFAVDFLRCAACSAYVCDRCADERPRCPRCEAGLHGDDRKAEAPAGRAALVAAIGRVQRLSEETTRQLQRLAERDRAPVEHVPAPVECDGAPVERDRTGEGARLRLVGLALVLAFAVAALLGAVLVGAD